MTRANVTEICVQNGTAVGVKVQPTFIGSAGEEVFVSARHVVSTSSVWVTNKIIKNPSLRIPIDHLTPGLGAMYIFFGMDKECPALPARNWWCYNNSTSYDFDEMLDNFLKLETQEYIQSAAPLLFVSFPSAKDPTYHDRCPGKGPTGVIITVAKWEWFAELVPEHEERWGVTLKKDRAKRPAEYRGIPRSRSRSS